MSDTIFVPCPHCSKRDSQPFDYQAVNGYPGAKCVTCEGKGFIEKTKIEEDE